MKKRKIYPDFQSYLEDFTRAGGLQSEFAARMGISEGYLSDIKSRRARPGFLLAKRLADECGVPLEAFLYAPERRAS